MTTEITPPDNIKREIDGTRDRIRSRMAKTVQNIFEIGRDLVDVKNKLDHGVFQHWVQSELGISSRTAQNFMNAADRLGSKSEIISHLPLTVVYALAAPSMPDDVRDALLKLAENGDLITETMVKEWREQAALKKLSSVSEKDTAEPNSTAVVTPETEKTDGADPPNAQDRFRDAYKAVLAEGGECGVMNIIRELMPDLAIIMADVEVTNLLTELEARGQEATEEGLIRLLRKWQDAIDMEIIIKPKGPPTTTGASAPGPDDDLLDIPPFLDRRGEELKDDHV